MEIYEETSNTVTILKLVGRLDAPVVKDLKNKMNDLIQRGQVNLVFDMADVNFMDSSGLGGMVAALRSVSQVGGDIKLARLQPRVRALFELTRLHQVFQIFQDVDAAVQSF
jgi:anti-sigma B factor antagonist